MYLHRRIEVELPVHQGSNTVCGECKRLTPDKYVHCVRACPHLISFTINSVNLQVVRAMIPPKQEVFPDD